jgi:hypothetical protein
MKTAVLNLVLILIIAPNLNSQGIPYGQQFQLSNYLFESADIPAVAGLSVGGCVVCYQIQDNPTTKDFNVYCQIYNQSFRKIKDHFRINMYSKDKQYQPVAVGLKNGKFVVIWTSFGQDGSGDGIFGRIFDNRGIALGDEFQVNTSTKGTQNYPKVAGLGNGGFIVCWSTVHSGNTGSTIYCQLYDDYGVKIGNEVVVMSKPGGSQFQTSIAALKSNKILVCWIGGIWAKLASIADMNFSYHFKINEIDADYHNPPAIASLFDGGFFACWQTPYRYLPHIEVYGQLFDSLGTKRGRDFQINTFSGYEQSFPAVASFLDGSFVVCWQSWENDGDGYGISGQLFDSSGAKIGREFLVNSSIHGDQEYPAVATLASGDFFVCWKNKISNYPGYHLYGKRLLGKPIVHQLQAFNLIHPRIDSTIDTTKIDFVWQKPSRIRKCYSWELTYDFYIDNDLDFSNPTIIKNIEDTTYTIDSLAAGKTYFWKVLAKNLAGDSLWSKQQDWGFFIKQGATSVETTEQNLPTGFELFQNYPNPFNSNTVIKYSLAENSNVSFNIYDVNARLIDEIIFNNQGRGEYGFRWTPQSLTSGVYLIKVQTKNWQKTIKAILLK